MQLLLAMQSWRRVISTPEHFSNTAHDLLARLDDEVGKMVAAVKGAKNWAFTTNPNTPQPAVFAVFREGVRALCWYHPHSMAAGFHMLGKLTCIDEGSLQTLIERKAEKAERSAWAREDLERLGGPKATDDLGPPSCTTFTLAAMWWYMARNEDPLAYLGAEYLTESASAIHTEFMPKVKARGISGPGTRFMRDHALEQKKYVEDLATIILRSATQHPERSHAILRGLQLIGSVYPVQQLEESFERAVASLDACPN